MAKVPTFNFGANVKPKKKPAGGRKARKPAGSSSKSSSSYAKALRSGSLDFTLPD
ncbi:MAG TPA: hypothetical protein VM597_29245 [Gemmataceae bacterium]|nr:hypothetical protein [Gemmataceae bacterium]